MRRKKMILLLIAIAAVVTLAVTLEFSVVYAFEYPSCLFVRELRVWDLCVHCRKRASALSEYIRKNHVAIDALPQRMLPVSVHTYSIRGVERRCGGLGSDLMKFDLYIRHCPMEKAEFHALLALADGRRDAEFVKKICGLRQRDFSGKLEFQLLSGSYIWYDEIDAVSFPIISTLKGEHHDIFDKTENILPL